MFEPVIGVQLYTLRNHTKTAEDLDETLGRLSAMGVRDVQLSAVGLANADANGDGTVNVMDITAIFNIISNS